MSEFTVIESMNNVRILLRSDGKYGVDDMFNNEITWRFRTLLHATEIAKEMSEANDRIDAYESSMK